MDYSQTAQTSGVNRIVAFLALIVWLAAGVPLSAVAQSFDDKIDALAKQLIEADPDPRYQEDIFKALSESTRKMIEAVDTQLVRIRLYKMSVNELKRERTLTPEQLRWLVEMEDRFVASEGEYRVARGMLLWADPLSGHSESFRQGFLSDAIRSLGKARQMYDKAKRDHGTLRTRIEIQSNAK